VRALIPTVGFYCWVTGIALVPVSTWIVVLQTYPFIASILACFFIGAVITRVEIFAMLLCFAGILVSALSAPTPTQVEGVETSAATNVCTAGLIFALVAATANASNSVLAAGLKNIHYTVLISCQCIVSFAVASVLMGFDYLQGKNPLAHLSET